MKKCIRSGAVVLCFFLTAVRFPAGALAEDQPKVGAKSAIVVNEDDGSVLYSKNERERLPIASTTKIMTALLTLEAAQKNNRTVAITPEMVRVEGSSMGLKAGDQLTLRALAEGMLTVSGNDAANSAAIAVGGTLERFASLMNRKAAQLGLADTHYVTPSGLDDKNHYSSAADLAALTVAAMKNSDFAQIVSQRNITVEFEKPVMTRRYTNHNRLLSMYDGCTGVKTGFTKKSGRCLVSSAQKNGVRLIAVTLNDPSDWEDHKRLFDYGFTKLISRSFDDSDYNGSVRVVGGMQKQVAVCGTQGRTLVLSSEKAGQLKRVVELPRFLYAPVENGQVVGYVRYTCEGKTVAATELVARGNVAAPEKKQSFWEWLVERIRGLFRVP